jgi:transcriptional adapter 2-alpha
MPGRLEFEHEVDNDAELVVKDFEFGLVYKYGGDEQPEAKVTAPLEEEEEGEDEDEEEATKTNAKVKQEEVRVKEEPSDLPMLAGPSKQSGSVSPTKKETADGKGKEKAEPGPDVEDEDELEVKLALLDIYFSKLDKREEAKDLIFDRGLTEYKKVRSRGCGRKVLTRQIQANEKKRPKDERELVQRYKVFAKLQTAQDFEVLIEGLICELLWTILNSAYTR